MKIIIGGDVSPRGSLSAKIDRGEFEEIMGAVKPVFQSADFSIINFETTIATFEDKPIIKYGPNLKTTSRIIELLQWVGVNVVTLANNHVGDFGPKAIIRVLEKLKDCGIKYVGAGINQTDAAKILYLKKNDLTVGIINCCEHEYGASTATVAGSNLLNPIKQYYAITEAARNSNYVIVIVHGGHEQFPLPSPRMQDTYRYFIDCGADAVINGHQHCFSGYEIYKNKPIYYGLGNLLFNWTGKQKPYGWSTGIMIELDFDKQMLKHQYIPYTQCENNLKISVDDDFTALKAQFESLSSIISNRTELEKAVDSYYSESQKSINTALQPWRGFFKSAYWHGLLPSLLSKDTLRGIHNMVTCEAHRDKLECFLKKSIF